MPITMNSQPATVTSYGRFIAGQRGEASLRLNDFDWFVELERQNRFRRYFDRAALGQHLRQRAASCACARSDRRPFAATGNRADNRAKRRSTAGHFGGSLVGANP